MAHPGLTGVADPDPHNAFFQVWGDYLIAESARLCSASSTICRRATEAQVHARSVIDAGLTAYISCQDTVVTRTW